MKTPTSAALCLLLASCSSDTSSDSTPTYDPTDCLVVCADLDEDAVNCDPPAKLCSLFPPQGSGLPVQHFVTVGEVSFPCSLGSYACYDDAEEFCEDLEPGDLDIVAPAEDEAPTPGPL